MPARQTDRHTDNPVGDVARDAASGRCLNWLCGQTADAETQTATDTLSENKGRL